MINKIIYKAAGFKSAVKKTIRKNHQKFNIKDSFKAAFTEEYIIGYWSNIKETENNWGDAINPYIIEKLSGKKVVHIDSIYNFKNRPVYSAVGSILDNSRLADISNLIVWGSGFKKENVELAARRVDIFAVRGPLTRKKLIASGFECPEVYGDPALLFPILYNKKSIPKYSLGIIPHYSDYKNKLIDKFRIDESILVIDINSGTKNVVDQVLSCERIASSSLHGLILSDAYKIPSLWIKFSDNLSGGDFKFYDYFLSIGRINETPLELNDSTTKNCILSRFKEYTIEFDSEALLKACPFYVRNNKSLTI